MITLLLHNNNIIISFYCKVTNNNIFLVICTIMYQQFRKEGIIIIKAFLSKNEATVAGCCYFITLPTIVVHPTFKIDY